MRILIVEDDAALGIFLQKGLQLQGHQVSLVRDGASGLAHALEEVPDLMVLDLSLPQKDGVQVLEEMKGRFHGTSVLVLTGRDAVDDRVRCLELGAEDCMLKPFGFSELTARCKVLIRRREQFADTTLRFNGVELNRLGRTVRRDGRDVELTAKEFALLEYLMQARGRCCTRAELLREVWQMSPDAGTNVVDVYVNYLRRKLGVGAPDRVIDTVRGEGYALSSPAARRPVAAVGGGGIVAGVQALVRAGALDAGSRRRDGGRRARRTMSPMASRRGEEQKMAVRSVVLASADAGLRQRLRTELSGMRWTVTEAAGGADAMARVEEMRPEALVVDNWLPDLEVGEFAEQICLLFPGLDVLSVDGTKVRGGNAVRSPRRNELLHAIREAQELALPAVPSAVVEHASVPVVSVPAQVELLPEMVGESAGMRELVRLIRLVAPRRSSVLIEGETGTGKEVVAKALHRLSLRNAKPFVVLNCAAIPESLLEAELFGHTRGAFTGAVQSRTGRIEAANGGTLFLDEIGEMPLALQAKMLRFLECGELQRVGDNDTTRVDVRVIAATHQPLEQRAEERMFRLDLYHRLAVFPVLVPALRERMEDLPLLVEYFLEQMGREMPRKSLASEAMELLRRYGWPGNVRELMHVLERGAILTGDRAEILAQDVRLHSRRIV